jgi:hypothetical protein
MSFFEDVPFILSRGNGRADESFQPVTLYLSITVPANAIPRPISPINTTSAIATEIARLILGTSCGAHCSPHPGLH